MSKNLIRVLGLKGAREILEYLNQHKKAQFSDMNDFRSEYTILICLVTVEL